MNFDDKSNEIEVLARMAATFAGREPDDHIEIRIGDMVVFSDVAWRYPDFIARAEAAFELLHRGAGF